MWPPLSLDEKVNAHRAGVFALRDGAAVEPPKEWVTLDERLSNFLDLQSPTLDQLCAAVTSGADNKIIIELRARALAEISALPPNLEQVNNTVAADIFNKMLAVYAKHAQPNYRQVASQFDSAAKDFTTAANTVDPATPAEQLVVADEPIRQAWSDAALHAARLDHLTDMLATAATLADVAVRLQPFDGGILALVADAATSDRAELFAAWQNKTGRVGCWSPLLKAGARLRAASLDGFKPYHPDDGKPAVVEPPIDPRRRPSRVVIA